MSEKYMLTVGLIPQEYEWKCPNCLTVNHIIEEKYPKVVECYNCENKYRAVLANCWEQG